MFRLWAKIFKDNRILKDYVSSTNDYSISRTDMVKLKHRRIQKTFKNSLL